MLATDERKNIRGKAAMSLSLVVVVAIFAMLVLDSQILSDNARGAFIGHADRAHVGSVAASIANGDGAVVNSEWLLVRAPTEQVDFPQRDPYWPTYPSRVISVAVMILGPEYVHVAVLITSSLMKLLTAAAVVLLLRTLDVRWGVAAASALIVLATPVVMRGVTGLTDIYFTASLFLTIALVARLVKGVEERILRWAGIAILGVVIGFCALSRPPVGFVGFLWVGLLAGLAYWHRRRRLAAHFLGAFGVGVSVVAPWFYANLVTFGSPIPPGYALVQEASRLTPIVGSDAAFYGVGSYSDVGTASRVSILWHSIKGFGWRGIVGGEAIPVWLTLSFIAVVAIVVANRWGQPRSTASRRFEFTTKNVALAQLVTAGMLGPALLAVVHFEARYWLFLIPVLVALIALHEDEVLYWTRQHPRELGGFGAVSIVLLGSLVIGGMQEGFEIVVAALMLGSLFAAARVGWRPLSIAPAAFGLALAFGAWYVPAIEVGPQQPRLVAPSDAFAQAAEIVPEGAVVLNSNPWQYAFHTGQPAVAVPYTSSVELIQSVAKHYRAEYLVVRGKELRHPEVLEAFTTGALHEDFPPVYEDDGLFIGRIPSGSDSRS